MSLWQPQINPYVQLVDQSHVVQSYSSHTCIECPKLLASLKLFFDDGLSVVIVYRSQQMHEDLTYGVTK